MIMNKRMMMRVAAVLLLGSSGMTAPIKAPAGVAVSPLFSDHMVLQRDKPLPVWGTAPAGTHVTVKFGSQEKSAEADTNNTWRVKLDPVKLSDKPQKLEILSALSQPP